jgi:protein-L-isoaspartate O-methyltransferase
MRFEDMEAALRQGVKVVSAPQLFPTPQALAYTIVREAHIHTAGMSVLEPSAGTGALLAALDDFTPNIGVLSVHAVELNASLAIALSGRYPSVHVHQDDFLLWKAPHKFDRIIANPPFVRGSDILHIKRMASLLKKGGRCVTLCAAGPRQERAIAEASPRQLGADVVAFERLPAGSFEEAGTNVNVALVVLEGL